MIRAPALAFLLALIATVAIGSAATPPPPSPGDINAKLYSEFLNRPPPGLGPSDDGVYFFTPTNTPSPTPTATPRPAATPIPAPINSNLLPFAGDVASVVCAPEFAWPCAWAVAVVQCESGGNPNAQGAGWLNGVLYVYNGWWQVEGGSFDPLTNTRQAYAKWLARGGAPWPNCP